MLNLSEGARELSMQPLLGRVAQREDAIVQLVGRYHKDVIWDRCPGCRDVNHGHFELRKAAGGLDCQQAGPQAQGSGKPPGS